MENADVRFAESLMRRYPRANLYPHGPWCYGQGFLLWGFIRLYEKTGREDFYEYIRAYGEEHVDENGRIARFRGNSLDDIMAGSVLVWLYVQTGEEKYKTACRQVREAYRDYPRNSDGGFWHARELPGEMWVDGLFMGLMFLTRYGKYIDEADWCFEETVKQLNIVFERCRKDRTGLLYHAYSEDRRAPWANKLTGCSPEVWSEGLGWYAMILTEVLDLLPEDYPGRDSIEEQLKLLCDDLVTVQDPACGLWYQIVDKRGFAGNFQDTSGSAMFTYTLSRAQKILNPADGKYAKAAAFGRSGILAKCVEGLDGEIHVWDACDGVCVQLSYDDYAYYTKTVDAKEAVAAVLWALVET